MNEEIWKPVPGFVGRYEVSNHGRVRSLDMLKRIRNGGMQPKPGRLISVVYGSHGYPTVSLSMDGKVYRAKLIHRLVAEVFVPNPEAKPNVNHKNGVRTDSHFENLEWVTQKENCIHAARILGTCRPPRFEGSKHPSAKLTEHDVIQIRSMTGSSRVVGDLFGVSKHTIKLIRKRRIWTHV